MGHKILIVDDDRNIRDVLCNAFSCDYTVLAAADGKTALELIKEEKPVLVLLDITMPGLSGLDVLMQVKEAGLPPVVWMLTGEEDLSVALKALEMGASGYQTKPFDIAKLREIVSDAVSSIAGKKDPGDKPWSVKKAE